MSEVKVNKISPRTNCGTVQLGDSGDTITIPAGATITNNGTQTGFGRTGTVDWDTTPKTATFSAVSGNGYFCNTTSSAFTVNLPAGSAGAIVSLADYAATWQTNSLTVSPNGSEKIGSVNADVTLNTEGQSVTFIYVDSTQGWINTMDSTSNVRGNPNLVASGGTETTSGDFKIHTFTGPGTFTVNNLSATAANNIVSYMVVGGGGNGGGDYGGGGGAGGFREYKGPADSYTASPLNGNPGGTAVTVTTQAYPITIGAGGTGSALNTVGNPGSPSTFSTITSTGGGHGGTEAPASVAAGTGGSGGGAMYSQSGAAGNTPPVSPPQGNNGGNGGGSSAGYAAGGGGGAGSAGGAPGNASIAGAGGNGVATSITASPVTRAGGGGGAGGGSPFGQSYTPGAGGSGGGGAGATCSSGAGIPGTVNTGSGGGGANLSGPSIGGNGGSGIVVIRYKFQ